MNTTNENVRLEIVGSNTPVISISGPGFVEQQVLNWTVYRKIESMLKEQETDRATIEIAIEFISDMNKMIQWIQKANPGLTMQTSYYDILDLVKKFLEKHTNNK